MKNTGIVRGIDSLGRIVLPKELRTTLRMDKDTQLEIYVEGESIILRKYQPKDVCELCGESGEGIVEFNGHYVCADCRKKLAAL